MAQTSFPINVEELTKEKTGVRVSMMKSLTKAEKKKTDEKIKNPRYLHFLVSLNDEIVDIERKLERLKRRLAKKREK